MPNVVIGFFLFRIFGIHHGQNHLTEHVYYETNFPTTGDLQIKFIIKIEVSKLKMRLIYKIIRALSLPIIVHKRVHQTMSSKVVIILYM